MAFLDDAFGDQIENLSEHYVDESVRENAGFHYEVGMKPKVIRISSGKCCDWCADMAGEYEYPNVPDDVYARHSNCDCTVEYLPGDGRRQNVWTKEWRENHKDEPGLKIKADGLELIKRRARSNGKKFADTLDYWKRNKASGAVIKDAEAFEAAGATYRVDGINVCLAYNEKEYDGAKLLVDTFGGRIEMIPVVLQPEKVPTPDYVFNGQRTDRKAPKGGGKRTIKNNIMAAKEQASAVLLDVSDCGLTNNSIMNDIERALNSPDCNFLDRLYVVQDNVITHLFERI